MSQNQNNPNKSTNLNNFKTKITTQNQNNPKKSTKEKWLNDIYLETCFE